MPLMLGPLMISCDILLRQLGLTHIEIFSKHLKKDKWKNLLSWVYREMTYPNFSIYSCKYILYFYFPAKVSKPLYIFPSTIYRYVRLPKNAIQNNCAYFLPQTKSVQNELTEKKKTEMPLINRGISQSIFELEFRSSETNRLFN